MLNKNQTGLALGALFATMHFLWVIIVFIGVGQWSLDLVYNMHFVTKSANIGTQAFGMAILGLALAFICGYVIAWAFAWFWNLFTKK